METKRVEDEYKTFMEGNLWPLVYQRIGQRCQSYPYTCIEAKKTENKPLNRYRDVNPYDHSRIVLQRKDFVTDYINANLVRMERANRQYILTQGPLVYTSGHFWLMVWEQKSPAIIMLNKIIEKSEIKCHWYWPHENGDEHKVVYPDVNLSITQISEMDFNYYTIRLLKITCNETEDTREIWHFHYTTWPDFEVPQSPHAFLDFLRRVREYGALACKGDDGPAIVHCSAGIGRSGTFCLVDSVLVLIEKEGQGNVDIQEILLEMRRYRMGLIQTSEQLRFSYTAIIEGIKRLDPHYKADEKEEEAVYAPVTEEEEAPPPPPPRGESLARPPARPLPAIPSSASMAAAARDDETGLGPRPSELSLYERRRRGRELAEQRVRAQVPRLAVLAAAALPGEPPAGLAPRAPAPCVPALALLAATVVLSLPIEDELVPHHLNIIGNLEELLVPDPDTETDDSVLGGFSSDENNDEFSADDTSMELSMDDSMVDFFDYEQPSMIGLAGAPAFLDFMEMRNIDLSTTAESDSDAPPTPPPRDSGEPRRDTPSPASSGYADEDIVDDDTTETTESTEPAESGASGDAEPAGVGAAAGAGGEGVRRRRALADRVALMKKRSREADRWHSFKRSLFKPLALSVGLLAVASVLIYVYAKH